MDDAHDAPTPYRYSTPPSTPTGQASGQSSYTPAPSVQPRPVYIPPPPLPTRGGKPPREDPSLLQHLLHAGRELFVFAILFVIVLFVSRQIVQNVQVKGTSMAPTLHTDELILVDTLSYRIHPPRRDDIIIFKPPVDVAANEDFVKRVIGLPGETVQVKHGLVYINGKLLDEPFVTMPHTYDWGPGKVPSSDLFVLGDNRNASYDSHLWRTPYLSQSAIMGRVLLSYWPLDSLHFFSLPIFSTLLPRL